jgi:hypothetical protein
MSSWSDANQSLALRSGDASSGIWVGHRSRSHCRAGPERHRNRSRCGTEVPNSHSRSPPPFGAGRRAGRHVGGLLADSRTALGTGVRRRQRFARRGSHHRGPRPRSASSFFTPHFASATGLVVILKMIEAELTELIGPKHARIPGRIRQVLELQQEDSGKSRKEPGSRSGRRSRAQSYRRRCSSRSPSSGGRERSLASGPPGEPRRSTDLSQKLRPLAVLIREVGRRPSASNNPQMGAHLGVPQQVSGKHR